MFRGPIPKSREFWTTELRWSSGSYATSIAGRGIPPGRQTGQHGAQLVARLARGQEDGFGGRGRPTGHSGESAAETGEWPGGGAVGVAARCLIKIYSQFWKKENVLIILGRMCK